MSDQRRQTDIANKPLPYAIVWGIPIAALISTNFLQSTVSFAALVLIMAGALAWMGLGCIINAARCGRLHCKFSGPIFMIGAMAVLLSGLGGLGTQGIYLAEIVWGTLLLALSTYVLEWIWGAYGTGRQAK